MSNGSLNGMPNVVAVATAPNYGRFAIGPLETGIGLPLGNALRRILLSSLPGSAITSVRIQGVYHEFSCIPFVREDVTEIILNIKNIRLRSYSERPVRLQVNKVGPGEVRASDIELPANIELVNPDLIIAHLDSAEAHFELELTVDRGRGYVSFEAREGLAIGVIPVDAIYSPVPKVNYLVEGADFDVLTAAEDDETEAGAKLERSAVEGAEQVTLEVWTDGTIDPGEALSVAAQYLAQHSSLIANFNRAVAQAPEREVQGVAIPPEVNDMPVDDLSLSMRTFNCLKRSGVTKVGQILRMDRRDLLSLRNFGEKSFVELIQALTSRELMTEGTPLVVTLAQANGAAAEVDGLEVQDSASDIGFEGTMDDTIEISSFMQGPEGAELQVVSPVEVSEGNLIDAGAGYPDEGGTQEMAGVAGGEVNSEAAAKPKSRSKKK